MVATPIYYIGNPNYVFLLLAFISVMKTIGCAYVLDAAQCKAQPVDLL